MNDWTYFLMRCEKNTCLIRCKVLVTPEFPTGGEAWNSSNCLFLTCVGLTSILHIYGILSLFNPTISSAVKLRSSSNKYLEQNQKLESKSSVIKIEKGINYISFLSFVLDKNWSNRKPTEARINWQSRVEFITQSITTSRRQLQFQNPRFWRGTKKKQGGHE